MRRLLIGLSGALGLSAIVAGCSLMPPVACPAIGWINAVSVTLQGPVQKVHTVELCLDGTCSITAGEQDGSDGQLRLATAIPRDAETPVPASVAPMIPPIGSRVDDRSWSFSLGMQAPKEVTVRALAADGATIAQREATLSWKRVGGTEQCGGPVATPPIILVIPN